MNTNSVFIVNVVLGCSLMNMVIGLRSIRAVRSVRDCCHMLWMLRDLITIHRMKGITPHYVVR